MARELDRHLGGRGDDLGAQDLGGSSRGGMDSGWRRFGGRRGGGGGGGDARGEGRARGRRRARGLSGMLSAASFARGRKQYPRMILPVLHPGSREKARVAADKQAQ